MPRPWEGNIKLKDRCKAEERQFAPCNNLVIKDIFLEGIDVICTEMFSVEVQYFCCMSSHGFTV